MVVGAAHDGLARVGDLTTDQASALVGGVMIGTSTLMDVKSSFKTATGLAKTHYELPHKTGHKDASSIFFKKSVDDSGIGLKSKSWAVESKSDAWKTKVDAHYNMLSELSTEMPIKRGADFKIKGVKYTQEHHVIHRSLADHELFKLAGMNAEDTANKMLLPTTKGSGLTTTDRSVHQGRHVNKVKEALERKMDKFIELGKEQNYTTEQYKSALQSIIREEKASLKSGDRILNAAKDLREPGAK